MNIIKPGFEIIFHDDPVDMQLRLERIARTCYKSEDKIGGDSTRKMLEHLIARGHEAMLEHEIISVRYIVDRGITHELVRHRIASFAQESTRYCNYSAGKFNGELTCIDINQGMALCPQTSKLDANTLNEIYTRWYRGIMFCEQMYLEMIELGASPQIARGVLPTSLKAEIVMTANIREWRAFFKLRADTPAHPQMREVTMPQLSEFIRIMPILFGDLSYLLPKREL